MFHSYRNHVLTDIANRLTDFDMSETLVCIGTVCIWVSPPSFQPSPPLNLQTVQAPPLLSGQSPPSILVFCEPSPLKVRFFREPKKYQSFSSLTPSCLLKSN